MIISRVHYTIACRLMQFHRALSDCKRLFPGRTNIDIIFGRPGQTLNDWKTELNKVHVAISTRIKA